MIHIDIIMTDEPESLDIRGTKDHKWIGLKDIMKKPRIGLFQLWTIKNFLEKSYGKLNKVQSSAKSDGKKVGNKGKDSIGSPAKL